MQDLIRDRGTREIPEEILRMKRFYPDPENYTYKVREINGRKTISIFPILPEEERDRRQMAFLKTIADVMSNHPDIFSE